MKTPGCLRPISTFRAAATIALFWLLTAGTLSANSPYAGTYTGSLDGQSGSTIGNLGTSSVVVNPDGSGVFRAVRPNGSEITSVSFVLDENGDYDVVGGGVIFSISISGNRASGDYVGSAGIMDFEATRATPPPVCAYSLSANQATHGGGVSSGSFMVATSSGCNWTAGRSHTWITTSSAGSGSGSVAYTLAANPASATRTGTITVGNATFTVTQGPSGYAWHTALGWLYESTGGWSHASGYGWMWFHPGGEWIYSTGLDGWLASTAAGSRTLWSTQFRWLTPSGTDPYRADTTTIGAISVGRHAGTPITTGWVVSDRFGYVWPAGDGTWFYSASQGWLGVNEAGAIWSVSQGRFL
jgi:hypothetical protein